MTAQGIMFKFTYRQDPKRDPNLVFDVVRFFPGDDMTTIKLNAKYHASKTGAIGVSALTEAEYKELLDEEAKRTQTETITA